MFVKVQQHKFGHESNEWYLSTCFLNVNAIHYAELRNHKELGIVVGIEYSDDVILVKAQFPDLPFPQNVRVD